MSQLEDLWYQKKTTDSFDDISNRDDDTSMSRPIQNIHRLESISGSRVARDRSRFSECYVKKSYDGNIVYQPDKGVFYEGELVTTKSLIENVISRKEKVQRRVESQLRGVIDKIRLSTEGEDLLHSQNTNPISGDIEELYAKSSKLKDKKIHLEDEIHVMKNHVQLIQQQLDESRQHAHFLSQSTRDWAGMYKETSVSNSIREQSRIFRQGAMVNKHSFKKRGCGPRFLAFREDSGELMWSKTMHGSSEIAKIMSSVKRKSGLSAGGSFKGPDAANRHGSSTNFISTRIVNANTIVLQGRESLQGLDIPKSSAHVSVAHMVYVKDKDLDNQLLFEFFDARLASDFAAGLNDYITLVSMTNDKENETLNVPSPALLLKTMQRWTDANSLGSRDESSFRTQYASFSMRTDYDEDSIAYDLSTMLRESKNEEEYLQILMDQGEIRLPLESTQTRRHNSADEKQVQKDLEREKSIVLNGTTFELGSRQNMDIMTKEFRKILREALPGEPKEVLEKCYQELLLASSRTIIEGDIYDLCHKLLAVPPERVVLCQTSSDPLRLLTLPNKRMVTIVFTTSYRIVGIAQGHSTRTSLIEWARVKVKCTELICLTSEKDTISERIEEENVRHVKLTFEA